MIAELNAIGKILVRRGVSANGMTLAGFLLGLLAMLMIGMQHYGFAVIFVGLNRFCDELM